MGRNVNGVLAYGVELDEREYEDEEYMSLLQSGKDPNLETVTVGYLDIGQSMEILVPKGKYRIGFMFGSDIENIEEPTDEEMEYLSRAMSRLTGVPTKAEDLEVSLLLGATSE